MGCCAESGAQETALPAKKDTIYSRRNVCCTDIIFLFLFVAFWCMLIYVAVFAVMNGNAKRLIYGYDSFGNVCNQEANERIDNLTGSGMNTSGLSNVFFMSMTSDPRLAMQVCVRSCPDRDLMTRDDVVTFASANGSHLCHYEVEPSSYKKQQFASTGRCPKLPIYKSISLLNRCVPDPVHLVDLLTNVSQAPELMTLQQLPQRQESTKQFFQMMATEDVFQKFFSDIYLSWRQILALCGVAVVIAFLMVLMMRFLAAIIVWLIVILAAVGSLVGTGFLWWTYYLEHLENNPSHTFEVPILHLDVQNEKAFLVFSIVATVLTVILLLILLVMRKRIGLVVALFHEAGKCLADVPLLLIQPFWTFVVLFVFFAYFLIIMGFIVTLGKAEPNYDKGFESVKYVTHGFARQFWWIHLIGLIWTFEFILACQQFVIASTVAFWYFSANKNNVSCPIGKSICRLILHHIGSVAFGSLLITLLKIPRYILMYIQRKCEASQAPIAKYVLKCCICCLWCLEKCVKFLNQNAYTIIAIDGKNFCSSAARAFSILTSNVLRVVAINSVGAFVLFLGKIAVMAATCVVAIFWLKRIPDMHFYAIPVVLISFYSFLIAHCFLSVYEMVVDALLLCFCEDCQMNDGTPGREYYMSTSLMEFVKDSSSKIELLNKSKAARQRAAEAGRPDAGQELQPMKA